MTSDLKHKLNDVIKLVEREAIEDYIEHHYGRRCKTKDTHDFPELKDDPLANRCPICEAWDGFDRYFEGRNA